MGQSIIIGGENYGQGSSREHAAINPMYLGVRAVIAKSIARIHKGNLINHGIIPMIFENPADYDKIEQGDELEINGLLEQMQTKEVEVRNNTKGVTFKARLELSAKKYFSTHIPFEYHTFLHHSQTRVHAFYFLLFAGVHRGRAG